jgi:hypothetical protein
LPNGWQIAVCWGRADEERQPHAKQRALLAEIEASRAEFEAGKSVPLTRELLRTIADGAKKRTRKRTAARA